MMMKNGRLSFMNSNRDFSYAVDKWRKQPAEGGFRDPIFDRPHPRVEEDPSLLASVLMNAMVDSVKGSCFNPETHVDITPRQFENDAKEIIYRYQEKLDDLLSEFNDDFSAFCDKAMGKEV